jgi:hypothetical protein
MIEVAGGAARLIPRMPINLVERQNWAIAAAKTVDEVISLTDDQRSDLITKGKLNIARFRSDTAIAAYEEIYSQTLAAWNS